MQFLNSKINSLCYVRVKANKHKYLIEGKHA